MTTSEVRLSQSSTEMFQNIMEDMRSYNFDSVNFAMLLYGILNTSEKKMEVVFSKITSAVRISILSKSKIRLV